MANGIRDRVAIVGMGCSRFGETLVRERRRSDARGLPGGNRRRRRGASPDRMAAWLGVCLEENNVGKTAGPLVQGLAPARHSGHAGGKRLRHGNRGPARSGLRGGRPAPCDFASPWESRSSRHRLTAGLPPSYPRNDDGTCGSPTARRRARSPSWPAPTAASTPLLAEELKRAMAHVSVKSHENGSRNPKAHLRSRISIEDVLKAPIIASPLGLYDCSGVSDGAACAIVTTPRSPAALGKKDVITVKALQLAVSSGEEAQFQHLGWCLDPHCAGRLVARLSGGGDPQSVRGTRSDRGTRLLFDHGTRADGGPRSEPAWARAP